MSYISPVFYSIGLLLFGSIAAVAGSGLDRFSNSRKLAGLAAIPGVGLLVMYYTLAVHVYLGFGGWPSYRTTGFSSPLEAHTSIVVWSAMGILYASGFLWIPGVIVSASIRPWRGWLYPLGIFAISVGVCVLLMLCAPRPFIEWLLD